MITDSQIVLNNSQIILKLTARADLIIFLYRHEVYFRGDMESKGTAELLIAKQRNGPIGTIDLGWRNNVMLFENPARV